MKKRRTGMDPLKMRFLDVWAGRPLCAFFTMIRALGRLLPRGSTTAEQPRKILFIKLVEQGATVLAYDAIRRAVEMVGEENVYFLVLEDNREILDLLDVIPRENVLAIRSQSLRALVLDSAMALTRARRVGIDATIDMEFFARAPAVLAYLTGAKRRVGLHRFTSELPYRGDLMTHRVQYNPYLSTAETYRMLLEALAMDAKQIPLLKCPPVRVMDPPAFRPSDDERAGLQQMLNRAAGRQVGFPIVILNPNASDIIPLRKWPADRFVELGKRLLAANPDLSIVITGSLSEEAAGEEIARAIDPDRAVSMAGKTSLRELLVLYTLADVMVTNDSGPGHFASLTEVDVVSLFGPETPSLYAPLGKHIHVIWAGLTCSPCVNAFNHRLSPCKDNVCMQAITVDQVHDLVCSLLAARKG